MVAGCNGKASFIFHLSDSKLKVCEGGHCHHTEGWRACALPPSLPVPLSESKVMHTITSGFAAILVEALDSSLQYTVYS